MKTIDWESWESIDGWMSSDAAAMLQCIAADSVGSGVLELGVYRGKLLSLAAALFSGPVVGVDAMWDGVNNPLTGGDLEYATQIVLSNVARVAGGVQARLVVSDTTLLRAGDLRAYAPDGFCFISVDGSHDADPVTHDLDLSASLLSRGGVICLDDGFNGVCPGVAEGFFNFLRSDSRLKAFATGYNKTLLTDSESYEMWLDRAYKWVREGTEPMYERTRQHLQINVGARWKPHLAGSEIVPFC